MSFYKHGDYCTAWPPKPADQCKLLHMSKVPNQEWRILFLCVCEHACLRVCVGVRACACVHVVCVCVRLCNLMVIFVSEGNLLKDLYNSTLKF